MDLGDSQRERKIRENSVRFFLEYKVKLLSGNVRWLNKNRRLDKTKHDGIVEELNMIIANLEYEVEKLRRQLKA